MADIQNPLVQDNWDNLSSFLENINCLYDTFEYSETMLKNQRLEALKELNAFLKPYAKKDGSSKPDIPRSEERTLLHLERKLQRTQESSKLLMRSYVVSMVSQFDAFIANLLRNIYDINPEKLMLSDHKLTYAELQSFPSIEAAKEHIIDAKIENILRDSHQEQFKELASTIGVTTLKDFPNWPVFVEITQRRNLFVHSNGVVSNQYLSICQKEGVELGDLKKGCQLEVDRSYFDKAFNVFYEVAIKLSQVVLRKLLYKKDEGCLADIDYCMIKCIYDLIYEKRYDVAIILSDFALEKSFKHSGKDRIFMVLNLAQAYKWKGDDAKCQSILFAEDTSAWSSELKCPKYALEGNINKVCEMMMSSGKNSEILTSDAYRTWPIFSGVRSDERFKETFKDIFGEDLEPEGLKDSSVVVTETVDVDDKLA